MEEGKKLEYREKTPDNKIKKKSHTRDLKSKPQPRLEPALGGSRLLTITPPVAPHMKHSTKHDDTAGYFNAAVHKAIKYKGKTMNRIFFKVLSLLPELEQKQLCLLVGCLTSQQHASVSQGRICSDNFTCCHTEIEAADPTFHLTKSRYTDTRPTSPSADPITPVA